LGLKRRDEKHKRISRWTWPLWMYVSVTGVIIYLLLYQIFPQR
jgi:putative membrane protein